MRHTVNATQFRVFGIGLPLILVFFAWRHFRHVGVDLWVVGLTFLSLVSLLTFVFFRGTFEQFFRLWMSVAGGIGFVVTTLVLTCVYFILFTPISLALRLMGKDFMSSRWNSQASSYWISSEKTSSKENYLNQF